jgi:protoporphyrinogen oxidase
MDKSDYKIHIIGAGVAGIVAALELEKAGYRPVIIEKSNAPGGRVKTHHYKGYQLDEGFQVLLEAYPMAKKYLNLKDLQVQKLLPGAVIYKNGTAFKIGDPTRDFSFLWSTLMASIGSVRDKVKIFRLNKMLKAKSLDAIFSSKEVSTLQYLMDFGFSLKIIEGFFRPFFTGIFLESELQTSSRMFEFVYKMFGEGLAVVPKHGIGAIPKQLMNQLKFTKVLYNTSVKEVQDRQIICENGDTIKTHLSIIATNPNALIPNLKEQDISWKSCDNLYFVAPSRVINEALIGLVAERDALVNNIFYHSAVETAETGKDELLSVTVVKNHRLNETELVQQVMEELERYCGITKLKFLKAFKIPAALPNIRGLQYSMDPENTRLKVTIFLAGDYLLNGSLNAAMLTGEKAAQGVISTLEDGLIVEDLTSEYIN